MVVLFVLQFRLADEKQSFHKLLHILGKWRRQICNEFDKLRHITLPAPAPLTSLISQQFTQQSHQHQINRFGETLVAVRFDLMQRENVTGLFVQVLECLFREQLLCDRENRLQMLNWKLNFCLFFGRLVESHIRKLIETRAVFGEEIRGRIVWDGEVGVQRWPLFGCAIGLITRRRLVIVESFAAQAARQRTWNNRSKLTDALVAFGRLGMLRILRLHRWHFGARKETAQQWRTVLRVATH